MQKRAGLAIALVFAATAAMAQDVPGVEDCTKTSGLDKRTGCFQSSINYLQTVITRNASDANRRLAAANAEIVALKASMQALQKTVEQLQAAAKTSDPKAPDTKAPGGKTPDAKAPDVKAPDTRPKP